MGRERVAVAAPELCVLLDRVRWDWDGRSPLAYDLKSSAWRWDEMFDMCM